MKILLTLTTLLVAFTTVAESKLITGYGFKTGLVMGTQNPKGFFAYEYDIPEVGYVFKDGIYSFEWGAGFSIMGYLEWFNTHPFNLITEIGYIGRGIKENITMTTTINYWFGDSTITTTRNFPGLVKRVDYLILSSLMKLTLSTKGVSPYLLIGPRFDIYLHIPFTTVPDYVKYAPVVFSGIFGVGIEFSLFKKFPMMFIEGQYNNAFTKSLKTVDSYWINSGLDQKKKHIRFLLE